MAGQAAGMASPPLLALFKGFLSSRPWLRCHLLQKASPDWQTGQLCRLYAPRVLCSSSQHSALRQDLCLKALHLPHPSLSSFLAHARHRVDLSDEETGSKWFYSHMEFRVDLCPGLCLWVWRVDMWVSPFPPVEEEESHDNSGTKERPFQVRRC